MTNETITKEDFSTYLFLMSKVFPESSDSRGILRIKNDLEKNYYPKHYKDGNFSRKTIDRNWNLLVGVRNNSTSIKKYLPKVSSVEVFLSYYLKNGKKDSLANFKIKNKEEIELYYLNHKPLPETLEQIFPTLPKEIIAIEERLNKVEELIHNYSEKIKERLSVTEAEKLKSYAEMYGEDKVALEFFNFLEADLKHTKTRLKRAQYLYNNFGVIGLFFIAKPKAINLDTAIWSNFNTHFNDLILLDEIASVDVDSSLEDEDYL